MRVLLTGSAGFIGSAVGAAVRAEGAEVVPVDVMLPAAHGRTSPPEGTHLLDVRDADGWRHVWTSEQTPGDAGLLARCRGPVLDVGCGPGRLAAGLLAAGGPADRHADHPPGAMSSAGPPGRT